MTPKMISYLRVSSDDQADRGYSLPSQAEAIRRYADMHGIALIESDATGPFSEDYSGATPIAERPVGRRVISMLKRREADGLIVHQVDRLSRDLVDALASVRDLTRAGLEVHGCDLGKIDNETDITLVIKAWQASDERKKIIERTSRGSRQKAKAGKVVGGGKSPYGYTYVHEIGNFEVIEAEADIVRKIYEWAAFGEGDSGPLTPNEITKRLSLLGVPVPANHLAAGKQQQRKSVNWLWNFSTVRRMLMNETYAGVWHYGKRDKGLKIRPVAETFAVEVPAIVSRNLWETVQERMTDRGRLSHRCKSQFLVRGLIFCKRCNRRMIGTNGRYYRCTRHFGPLSKIDPDRCPQLSVRTDWVDDYAWEYVYKILTTAEDFEAELHKAQTVELSAIQPKIDELGHVDAMITAADAELDEVLAMMKGLPPDSLRYKKRDAEAAQIEARIMAMKGRHAEIQATIDTRALTEAEINSLMQFRTDAADGLDNPEFEDKRRILEVLRVKVVVHDYEAVVSCRLPIDAVCYDVTHRKRQRLYPL